MQTIGGASRMHGDLGRFYDAIENPRRTRGELPILRDAELRAYLADVRERTLDVLDGVDLSDDAEDPLLRGGFVYEMLLAHEHQHNETMLQLLQMVDDYEPLRVDLGPAAGPVWPTAPRWSRSRPESTRSAPRPTGFAYDNERPRHTVELAAVRDRPQPGLQRRLRSPSSRRPAPSRRCTGSATGRVAGSAPRWAAASRSTRRRPVIHVSWERRRRLRPLGRQAAADRARVGGGPRRACDGSAQVWEWTSSDFLPIPASRRSRTASTPRSSSATSYKVLRGGSWATHRSAIRPSFRNWDLPERRQIFCRPPLREEPV